MQAAAVGASAVEQEEVAALAAAATALALGGTPQSAGLAARSAVRTATGRPNGRILVVSRGAAAAAAMHELSKGTGAGEGEHFGERVCAAAVEAAAAAGGLRSHQAKAAGAAAAMFVLHVGDQGAVMWEGHVVNGQSPEHISPPARAGALAASAAKKACNNMKHLCAVAAAAAVAVALEHGSGTEQAIVEAVRAATHVGGSREEVRAAAEEAAKLAVGGESHGAMVLLSKVWDSDPAAGIGVEGGEEKDLDLPPPDDYEEDDDEDDEDEEDEDEEDEDEDDDEDEGSEEGEEGDAEDQAQEEGEGVFEGKEEQKPVDSAKEADAAGAGDDAMATTNEEGADAKDAAKPKGCCVIS
jgi:hypothetical protein